MITLTIGNSYSKITGLDDKQLKALRKVLSYKLDKATAAFIPNPSGHVKYCIDLKGNFASGLLSRVQKFLSTIPYVKVDTRSKEAPERIERAFKSTFNVTPYPDQELALKAVHENVSGILSLPTGTGKSIIIAMILERLKLRTLIIVPTLELKSQLTESLKDQLTTMSGVVIENIDNNSLLKAKDFDCLIIDECHHSAAKTYHKLNKSAWGNIKYRYMMTATPFRNNKEETLMFESIAGRVVYELSYQDAVKAGYIVPVEAYYLDVNRSETDGVTYAQVYSQLVVNNDHRNLLIGTLLARLHEAGQSTLCLVKEVKHGELIRNLTGLPFANGADNDTRWYIQAFAQGRINSLIGTTGLIGEGVDTKSCEWVIIAGLGKAKSAFLQQVGRAVRTYPGKDSAKVVILRDKSHRFTARHFNEQRKILLDYYGVDVVKLEI